MFFKGLNLTLNKMLKQLATSISKIKPNLKFTLLEIGARGVHEDPEPFYQILDFFPGSTIIGFEIEVDLCQKMNNEAGSGLKFFPVALGSREGEQCMYITEHPMCCSLYEPNPIYIDLYNNLQYQSLVKTDLIRTTTLDLFLKKMR